jgi:hypothetical protein
MTVDGRLDELALAAVKEATGAWPRLKPDSTYTVELFEV